MGKLRASLCIVTYNNKDNIEAALNSIFRHSRDVEITVYVSDNCSSDGTPAIIKNRFPQVKLLKNSDNKGFGAGHNKVLPFLDSDYHFIVNPDVILKNDVIGEMCAFMEGNPDIVMAVPRFVYDDGREQFTPKLTPTLKYMMGGRLERFGGIFKKWRDEYTFRNREVTEVTDVGFCSGCFIVIRTDVFRSVRGFDERYFLYSEDADLTRTAQFYGRTVYAPQFYVVHQWERAYMKKFRYFLIQISSMIKYFYKWRKNGKYALKNK